MNELNSSRYSVQTIVKRLFEVISYLLDVIRQKDEQIKPKYKIVDFLKETGLCKILVHGTGVMLDCKPSEILKEDSLISGFHPVDVMTITNLANYDKYKPKASLSSISYGENIVFSVKTLDGNEDYVTINELLDKNEIIEKLSNKDAFLLGRIIGDHDALVE